MKLEGKRVEWPFIWGMVVASVCWWIFFLVLVGLGQQMDQPYAVDQFGRRIVIQPVMRVPVEGPLYDQQKRGIDTHKKGLKHEK